MKKFIPVGKTKIQMMDDKKHIQMLDNVNWFDGSPGLCLIDCPGLAFDDTGDDVMDLFTET